MESHHPDFHSLHKNTSIWDDMEEVTVERMVLYGSISPPGEPIYIYWLKYNSY